MVAFGLVLCPPVPATGNSTLGPGKGHKKANRNFFSQISCFNNIVSYIFFIQRVKIVFICLKYVRKGVGLGDSNISLLIQFGPKKYFRENGKNFSYLPTQNDL